MAGKRLLIHSLFLLMLPILVALFGVFTAGAIALVLVALAWRLAITLSVLLLPAHVPKLELETIAASHFSEKVRWPMDRLGIEYVERSTAGGNACRDRAMDRALPPYRGLCGKALQRTATVTLTRIDSLKSGSDAVRA